MFLREFFTESPITELRITIDEGVPGWLISLILIDTGSSQWRKTKRGSIQTEELKCVQTALKKLGYDPGKIDGWFGKKTARAVMKFQKDNDLTADGDPGRNTIGKMIELGKEENPAASDLTKDNIDDRFPADEYPNRQKCDAVLKPEPEEDDEEKDDGEDKEQGGAAYKTVTGSGQGRRYRVYDADGKELRSGRGPGPAGLPTEAEFKASQSTSGPDDGTRGSTGPEMVDNPPVTIEEINPLIREFFSSNFKDPAVAQKFVDSIPVRDRSEEYLDKIGNKVGEIITSLTGTGGWSLNPGVGRAKVPAEAGEPFGGRLLSIPVFNDYYEETREVLRKYTRETLRDAKLAAQAQGYSNEFNPEKVTKNKTPAEVEQILVRLIQNKKYDNAYALAMYDERVSMTPAQIQQLAQLAGKQVWGSNTADNVAKDVARAAGIDVESLDEKQVWARSGMKVVRKYRCSAGSRKGRIVKEPSQCFRAPDIKKRIKLKQTKARLGARMARKAKRTKKFNPASRRVQSMNKSSR